MRPERSRDLRCLMSDGKRRRGGPPVCPRHLVRPGTAIRDRRCRSRRQSASTLWQGSTACPDISGSASSSLAQDNNCHTSRPRRHRAGPEQLATPPCGNPLPGPPAANPVEPHLSAEISPQGMRDEPMPFPSRPVPGSLRCGQPLAVWVAPVMQPLGDGVRVPDELPDITRYPSEGNGA
jgi:hypothetical protein